MELMHSLDVSDAIKCILWLLQDIRRTTSARRRVGHAPKLLREQRADGLLEASTAFSRPHPRPTAELSTVTCTADFSIPASGTTRADNRSAGTRSKVTRKLSEGREGSGDGRERETGRLGEARERRVGLARVWRKWRRARSTSRQAGVWRWTERAGRMKYLVIGIIERAFCYGLL
ncbi:unnamed protein product [Leptidea sinapis]|uniref:Uncharacterized protein n=1 Tax=Leptidea sinapis TaxID=189913 RepID=A0A5E4QF54_9NEOP|nr:unnamed protein product [Leptidea sinapis]